MRKALGAVSALVLLVLAVAPPPALAQEKPVSVAYYYRVRWGFQPEFERLFFKNHYPVLKEQMESGRIKAVTVYRPTFHGEGRADWTFLVVIRFASWSVLGGPSPDEEIAKRLYPDQDTFKREEQRRFEILDAHWDVPLSEVEPPR
jgi:hypothetical protein